MSWCALQAELNLEGARAATAVAAQDHPASTSPLLDIEDTIPLPAASGYGTDTPNAQVVAPAPG